MAELKGQVNLDYVPCSVIYLTSRGVLSFQENVYNIVEYI